MRIDFKTPSGQKCQGDLVVPEGEGKTPGVVLIQEWWGVNDHIRDVAARLAKEGFRVLAPDLYHGKTTKDPGEAAKMMGALDWKQALDEIAGAAEHLRAHESSNGKVAVMGFCMGGALSLASACNVPHLWAVTAFYGIPDPKFADYTKVTAPIMAHVAGKDDWVKPEAARAIQKQIHDAGKVMDLHVYDDADHAFFNDTRPEVHSPANAKLAWDRTLAFFKKHLSS